MKLVRNGVGWGGELGGMGLEWGAFESLVGDIYIIGMLGKFTSGILRIFGRGIGWKVGFGCAMLMESTISRSGPLNAEFILGTLRGFDRRVLSADGEYHVGDQLGLTQGDFMNLYAISIAAGSSGNGITMETKMALLTDVFDFLKEKNENDAHDSVERYFWDLQIQMMMHSGKDFISTQSFAPFSKRGKSNFGKLYAAYLHGGDHELREAFELIVKNQKDNPEVQNPIKHERGKGESKDDAIVIQCDDPKDIVRAEYWYLVHHYGEIEVINQTMVTGTQGEKYDCIQIETPNGEIKTFFFDLNYLQRA